MGNSQVVLASTTKKKCDSWWRNAVKDLSCAQDQLLDDQIVTKLLEDERFHLSQVLEGCLKADAKIALQHIVEQGMIATEAGVKEKNKRFLVERLTLELASRARLPPASALALEKQLLVMSTLPASSSTALQPGTTAESEEKEGTPDTTEVVPILEYKQVDVGGKSGLEQLGLGLMVRFLHELSPSQCPGIATHLQQTLSKIEPLQLYNDWADINLGPPEKELELRPGTGLGCVEVSSTNSHEPSSNPLRALQNNTFYFGTKSRKERTNLTLRFSEVKEISSARLQWHKSCLPKFIEIQVSKDGENYEKVTCATVKPLDGHECYIPFGKVKECFFVKFYFVGFARCNTRTSHKLERLRVFTPAKDNLCTPTPEILRKLWDWIYDGAHCPESAEPCLTAVFDLLGASGSLDCLIKSFDLLWHVHQKVPESQALIGGTGPVNIAAKKLLATMESHLKEIKSEEDQGSKASCFPTRVVFEPAVATLEQVSMTYTPEDHAVSCSGGHASDLVALLPAKLSVGRASWSFEIGGQLAEGVLLGVARRKVAGRPSDEPDSWFVDCGSGKPVINGAQCLDSMQIMDRIQPGDVVRMVFDIETGELKVALNGDEAAGMTFQQVAADTYPAVMFKTRSLGSGEQEVRLANGVVELSRQPWSDYVASLPTMDKINCAAFTQHAFWAPAQPKHPCAEGEEGSRGAESAGSEGPAAGRGVFYPHALMMVPKSNANATTRYLLQGNYSVFESEVMLAEDHTSPSTSTVFQVICDGVVLWTSSPLSGAGSVDKVRLTVLGVNELKLSVRVEKASLEHTSEGASTPAVDEANTANRRHDYYPDMTMDDLFQSGSENVKSVWVAPKLHRVRPQNPMDCLFEGERPTTAQISKLPAAEPFATSSAAPLFCRGFRPSQLTASATGSGALELCMCGRPRHLHADTLSQADQKEAKEEEVVADEDAPAEAVAPDLTCLSLLKKIWELAGLIAQARVDAMTEGRHKAQCTPGAPFCIEADATCIEKLCSYLDLFSADDGTKYQGCVSVSSVLRLLKANLRHLVAVKQPLNGDSERGNFTPTMQLLKKSLESLMRTKGADAADYCQDLASTVESGLPFLYPDHDSVAELLQTLLLDESGQVVPLTKCPPASMGLLVLLLRRLIEGGEGKCAAGVSSTGSQDMLRVVGWTGAGQGTSQRPLLNHLLTALRSWSEDADPLNSEQQQIITAVRDVILQAHYGIIVHLSSEEEEAENVPQQSENSKHALSQEFVKEYTAELLDSCADTLGKVGSITDPAQAAKALEGSLTKVLLPLYSTALCLVPHRLWLGAAVLPRLLPLIQVLEQVNQRFTDIPRVERLLQLEQRINARKEEGLDEIIAPPITAAKKAWVGHFDPRLHGNGVSLRLRGRVASMAGSLEQFGVAMLALPRGHNLRDGTHEFTFQIITRYSRRSRLSIGLIDVSDESSDLESLRDDGLLDSYVPEEEIQSFFYEHSGRRLITGQASPFGRSYQANSIVTMVLDFGAVAENSRGTVSFIVDGRPTEVMVAGLAGATYCPCVLLEGGDEVKFVKYEGSLLQSSQIPQGLMEFLSSDGNSGNSDGNSGGLEHALALRRVPRMGRNLQSQSLSEVSVVAGSDPTWGTALFEPSIPTIPGEDRGVHQWSIEISCLGQDGALCVGLARGDCSRNGLLGTDGKGWGLLGDGRLWWTGAAKVKPVEYGAQLCVGDMVTVTLNLDLRTLSFGHNGRSLGVAFGPPGSGARVEVSEEEEGGEEVVGAWNPQRAGRLYPAVSLYGHGDKVKVVACGLGMSTFQMPWTHHLLKLTCSLAGRMSSELIAGNPISTEEVEFAPWLAAPFLAGGVHDEKFCEDILGKKSSVAVSSEAKEFLQGLLQVGEDGAGYLLFSWLEEKSTGQVKHLKGFPEAEQAFFAALVSQNCLWKGAQQLLSQLQKGQALDNPVDVNDPVVKRLMVLWNICHDFRMFLRHKKQVFTPLEEKARANVEPALEQVGVAGVEETKGEVKESESKEEPVVEVSVKEDQSTTEEKKSLMPETFEQLLDQVLARVKFLLHLQPAAIVGEEGGALPKKEADEVVEHPLPGIAASQSMELPPSQDALSLRRWNTSQTHTAQGKSWNKVLNVLHAQHQWRLQHGRAPSMIKEEEEKQMSSEISIDLSRRVTPQMSTLSDKPEDVSKGKDLGAIGQQLARSCFLYATEGYAIMPETLKKLSLRRWQRASQRTQGLCTLRKLLGFVHTSSAVQDTLAHLRPAFRCLVEPEALKSSEDEEEKKEKKGKAAPRPRVTRNPSCMSEVTAERHHYDSGLCGGFAEERRAVQLEFYALFQELANLMRRAIAKESKTKTPSKGTSLDAALVGGIIWSWSLDFEGRDADLLLKTDIVPMLHKLVSIDELTVEIQRSLENDWYVQKHLAMITERTEGSKGWVTEWQPWGLKYVTSGLQSGTLSKRRLLHHMRQVPPSRAPPAKWWEERGLGSGTLFIGSHHAPPINITISALIEAYEEFLQIVLSEPSARKPTGKSDHLLQYVHLDREGSLLEVKTEVSAPYLSLEFWIRPLEGAEISHLVSFVNSSGYGPTVILKGGDLMVEVFFNEYNFPCQIPARKWTHVCLVWAPPAEGEEGKKLKFYLNGELKEELHLKAKNDLSYSQFFFGRSSSSDSQLGFCGRVAHVRLWKGSRSSQEIKSTFNKDMSEEDLKNENLVGYWPLLEGDYSEKREAEGIAAFEAKNCELVRSESPYFALPTHMGMADLIRLVVRVQKVFRGRRVRRQVEIAGRSGESCLLEAESRAFDAGSLHDRIQLAVSASALLKLLAAQFAGGSMDRLRAEAVEMEAGAVRAAKRRGAQLLKENESMREAVEAYTEGGLEEYLDETAKVVRRIHATNPLAADAVDESSEAISNLHDVLLEVQSAEISSAAQLFLRSIGKSLERDQLPSDSEAPPMPALRKTVSEPVGSFQSKAASNLKAKPVQLETLELDNILYNQLTSLLSLCDTDSGRKYACSAKVLTSILQLVVFGSPRLQFICLKLFEEVATCGLVQASVIDRLLRDHVTTEYSGFLHYLMVTIGNSLVFPILDGSQSFRKTQGQKTVEFDDVSVTEGAGSGYIIAAIADQCIIVLHALMGCEDWRPQIISKFIGSMKNAPEILEDPLNEDNGGMLNNLFASLAALGGVLPILRFGGKAGVEVKDGALSRSASAAEAESTGKDGRVVATIVEMNPYSENVRIVFGGSGSVVASHEQKLEKLVPVDFRSLPEKFATKETVNAIIKEFLKLMKAVASKRRGTVAEEESKASCEPEDLTPYQYTKSVLTNLWVLILRSFPHLIPGKVEHGIMVEDILPFLYETSLQCVDLPNFVSPVSLENQSRHLKQRISEAHIPGGGTSLNLKGNQEEEETKTEEQLREEAKQAVRAESGAELNMMLGFPLPLCIKALELNDDQPDRAAEWLFSGQGDAFAATGGGSGIIESKDGEESVESRRWVEAEKLTMFTQMHPKLCYQALELCNDKSDEAGAWLLDEGKAYMNRMVEEEKYELPIARQDVGKDGVPLGMQSGFITDTQLQASSSYDDQHAARYARLQSNKGAGAWCPGTNDANQFLQIDLGGIRQVQAIATQGRCATSAVGAGSNHFVQSYKVTWSTDNMAWNPILPKTSGAGEWGEQTEDVFKGNSNCTSVQTNQFKSVVEARYIRILPSTWSTRIAMRVELYGPTLGNPVGLQSGALPDLQLSASSCLEGVAPSHGRLRSVKGHGAWVPAVSDDKQFYQVDLGYCATVTGIATQGKTEGEEQWVSQYKIQTSNDQIEWTSTDVLEGNQNGSSIAVHNFKTSPIHGRYLRLVPVEFRRAIALRLELFSSSIGAPLLEHLSDTNFVCTSHTSIHFAAHFARLNGTLGKGGWSPLLAEASSQSKECYIEIDLGVTCELYAIASQGQSPIAQLLQGDDSSNWVTRYEVKTSQDGDNWQVLSPDGGYEGNCDCDSIVINQTALTVLTRFVRVRPLSWHNKPVLRLQLFGQPAGLPMGLQSESISDDQITASSHSKNGPPKCFRLNNHGAWRPETDDIGQHLTVKLRARSLLTGFATQGGEANDGDLAGWVTSFVVSVSTNGEDWEDLVADEGSKLVEFEGNVSPLEIKTYILSEPKWARFVKFKPLCWIGAIAMRAELYGMGVENPMGMEHGTISDSQITASSATSEGTASKGRLHGSDGAWIAGPNDENQFLQVDFKSRKTVVGVSVQGKSADSGQEAYVTSFCMQHSLDGESWKMIKNNGVDVYFSGNSTGSDVVTHLLPSSIITQFIRICPKSWVSTIALRVELYGVSRSTNTMEDDEAALEDSTTAIPLLLSSSARATAPNDPLLDQETMVEDGAKMASAPIFLAQLAPLWVVTKETQAQGAVRPHEGMLVTLTEKTGNVSTINGRTGWLESVCDNGQHAKVHFLDIGTGLSINERVPLDNLKAHVQLYGQKFKSTREAKEYAVSVESALAIHYARRALLSFLDDWKKVSEESKEGPEALSLAAIGGPIELIKLLKLLAASEGSLSMRSPAGNEESHSLSNESLPLTRGMRDICEFLLLKEAPKTEKAEGKDSEKDEEESSLSQVLVEECVSHFVQSTMPADSRNVQVRESLHPYSKKRASHVEGVVKFEGATALRVHFDPRCRTLPSAELKFALDAGFGQVIQRCSGGPSSFRPFLIHSDRFHFRFTSDGQQDNDCWGYQFSVVPLLGLHWLCESQVLTEPSLEWACWLLDFLLAEAASSQNSAAPVLPQGAVHNNTVFGALVRYLRSGGVPYKHHVISLLTRLLHFSDLFSTRDPPNLGLLAGIVSLVKERCQVAEANSGEAVTLPIRLQALMELSVAARLAAQPSDSSSASPAPAAASPQDFSADGEVNEPNTEDTSIALRLPPNPNDLPTVDVLVNVLETAKYLSEGEKLPEELLCEAYLKGVGIEKVIDSEQLLSESGLESLLGEVKFDGAKELHVRLLYDPIQESNDKDKPAKVFSSDAEMIIDAVPPEECSQLETHGLEFGLDIYKPPVSETDQGVEETKGEEEGTEQKTQSGGELQSGELPGQTPASRPELLSVSVDGVPTLVHAQAQVQDSNSSVSPLASPSTGGAVFPETIPESESGYTTPDYGRPRESATTGQGLAEVNQMVELEIPREWAEIALRRSGWSVENAVTFCFENDMNALVQQERQMDRNALRNWNRTNEGLEGPDREVAELMGMDNVRRGGVVTEMASPEATAVSPTDPEDSHREPSPERPGNELGGLLRRHDTMGEGWEENLAQATAEDEVPESTGTGVPQASTAEESQERDQQNNPNASEVPVEEATPLPDPEATATGSLGESQSQPESTVAGVPSTEPEDTERHVEGGTEAQEQSNSDTETHPEAVLMPEEGPQPESEEPPSSDQIEDSDPDGTEPQGEATQESEVAAQPGTQDSIPWNQAAAQRDDPPSDACSMMMAMGLSRAMCELALRRTQNDVQMAIELCFEGGLEDLIEDNDLEEQETDRDRNETQDEEPIAESTENQENKEDQKQEGKEQNKPVEEETPEDKAKKEKQEAYQNKFTAVSSELVLNNGVHLSLLLTGIGFLGDVVSAGVSQGLDLSTLLILNHPESSKYGNKFTLQNSESRRYLVALPDGTLSFRQGASSATAFQIELYNQGMKLALKTPDGRYVKFSSGELRTEAILKDDLEAPDGPHLFGVIARTKATEDNLQTLPEPARVTLASPGRPLGMGSGAIKDSQITASSEADNMGDSARATNGRLTRGDSNLHLAWYAAGGQSTTNEYLQVDLEERTLLTGISMQGPAQCFVQEYRLGVSDDGDTWAMLKERGVTLLFPGNIMSGQVVSHRLRDPIACRFVRIWPTKCYERVAMRIELHGVQRYKIAGGLPLDSHHLTESIVIPGDSLRYVFKPPPQDSTGTGWPNGRGFKFIVTAVGMGVKEKEVWLKNNLGGFQEAKEQMQQWTPQVDEELSIWITRRAELNEEQSATSTLQSSILSLTPHEVVLTPSEQLQLQLIASRPATALHVRFSLLQEFNRRLRRVLPCVDLNTTTSWRIGSQLRNAGHCVFHDLKIALLEDALQKTATGGNSISLLLDHKKKTLSHDREWKDPATSQCVFVQAFQQIHDQGVEKLRISGSGARVFRVQYDGEGGIDAGGVYREAVTEMVEDLHSPDFNLMVLCPNGQHKINVNMDKYIPSPHSKSPLAIQMLEFIGKLMGISLRTKATLPFDLPAFVWKGVLGHKLNLADLKGFDSMAIEFIQALRGEEDKMDKEEFEAAYGDYVNFTTTGSAGETVELIPNGAQVPVTFYNRLEYCDKVEHYRLHELDHQFAAMRRGLGCIVPLNILQLFTWQQVEVLIAGHPDIDVDYLKEHTEVKGFPADSDVIKWFWSCMKSFSNNERSQFIRFVWGRSRLPNRGRTWPQLFKIQSFSRPSNDETLPETHTCFFSIEMPVYSSEEIMRKRLLTAINFGVGGILNG